MLSYAQNGEDVVLQRAFRDLNRPGFYVDIGACHPTEDSVTHHFHEMGWRGINVEPDGVLHAALAQARPQDVNLRAAVGRARGQALFQPTTTRGHGTLHPELARARVGNADKVRVPVLTLPDVIDLYGPEEGDVAFLKVDVEGWEAEVLASGDWERHRPVVVLVEAVDEEGRPTHQSWEPDLLASRYRFALFDGLNRFYVREEDAERLLARIASPANVLDGWRRAREVDAERRAELISAELAAAEVRAEALGADAEEARAAADVLEAERHRAREELAAARTAVEGLEAERLRAREAEAATLDHLRGELAAARTAADVLEAERQRAREAEAAALGREETAEARLAELETAAALRSAELQRTLEAELQRVREVEAAALGREEAAQARVAELEKAGALRSAELQRALEEAMTALRHGEAQLETVRRSTSWRVSSPVRLTGRMIKRVVGRNG